MLPFAEVLRDHPDLADDGFGQGSREVLAAVPETRIHALSQFMLAHYPKRKEPNPQAYSGRLKHDMEDAFRQGYVSRGEAIAAALCAGYPIRKKSDGSAELDVRQSFVDRIIRRDFPGSRHTEECSLCRGLIPALQIRK